MGILVFSMQQIQEAIRWRGDQFFKRVDAAQLHFEQTNLALWRRGIHLTPAGATVLVGDSHLQGVPASALGPTVLNLSIGGMTGLRFEKYLADGRFPLPEAPKYIVLWLGHNDLNSFEPTEAITHSLGKTIAGLARLAPLYVLEMLPPGSAQKDRLKTEDRANLNLFLDSQCRLTPNCVWVDLAFMKGHDGALVAGLVGDDNFHLSRLGYDWLLDGLKNRLKEHGNGK